METKLAKAEHHIIFLSWAIDEQILPNGLTWDITVNVMEPDDKTNETIQKHIKVFNLMEIMRTHYDQLEAKLEETKL